MGLFRKKKKKQDSLGFDDDDEENERGDGPGGDDDGGFAAPRSDRCGGTLVMLLSRSLLTHPQYDIRSGGSNIELEGGIREFSLVHDIVSHAVW